MLKQVISLILISFAVSAIGQTFEFEADSNNSINPIWIGDVNFFDADGDLDQDIIITGIDGTRQPTTELYKNDGKGNFTLDATSSFTKVGYSSLAVADVDGDKDMDVIVMGEKSFGGNSTELYLNNGTGKFTKMANHPFPLIKSGAVSFADIDGDKDMDLLISGYEQYNLYVTKLYKNDGKGNFSEVANTPFIGLIQNTIDFVDIDGDLDLDLLLTGKDISKANNTKLYINDGTGNYNESTSSTLPQVTDGDVAFADVDNDDDMDMFICGFTSGIISKLFLNNGSGVFTESQTSFVGVYSSSVEFADFDKDNDVDLLIVGDKGGSSYIAFIYENDGKGDFSKVSEVSEVTNLLAATKVSTGVADIDGDFDLDLYITGSTSLKRDSKLYINKLIITSLDHSSTSKHSMFYPNPTKGYVHFSENVNYEITNSVGEKIIESRGESADLSSFLNGIYFIKVKGQTQRVIKL